MLLCNQSQAPIMQPRSSCQEI